MTEVNRGKLIARCMEILNVVSLGNVEIGSGACAASGNEIEGRRSVTLVSSDMVIFGL